MQEKLHEIPLSREYPVEKLQPHIQIEANNCIFVGLSLKILKQCLFKVTFNGFTYCNYIGEEGFSGAPGSVRM